MARFATHLPYWRNEATEGLREVVEAFSTYINNLDPTNTPQTQVAPTTQQISILRTYIIRWANYGAWIVTQENAQFLADIRESATKIASFPDARQWLIQASSIGIDPF